MAFRVRFHRLLRRICMTPACSPLSTCGSASKFTSYAEDCKHVYLWARRAFRVSLSNALSRQYRDSPGTTLIAGGMCGISIGLALMNVQPHVSYAMDGLDIIVDDSSNMASGGLDPYRNSDCLPSLVRRLWLPLLLLLRVFWNLDSPITLMMTVTTLLLSTKPRPFSIYLVIDKLCHQYELQVPHKSFEPLYARKVEVEDYLVACLARVQIRDDKFTFIGILGSWWVL